MLVVFYIFLYLIIVEIFLYQLFSVFFTNFLLVYIYVFNPQILI